MQDTLFPDEIPRSLGVGPAARVAAPGSSARQGGQKVRLARAAAQWRELALQLPAHLRFGVSTWSYPGWEGLVWEGVHAPGVLSRYGLSAYHQHPLLRTVCIDHSFWQPLTAVQYSGYAAQVDTDFRFVVKCPASVTDALVRAGDGRARQPNPGFLDPRLAIASFVQPVLDGLGARLGVMVFQLSPLPWSWLSRPGALLERLEHLLAAVRQVVGAHSDVIVAVEVRDPELLTQHLAAVLRGQGATFCLGLHGKMPPIEAQLPLLRALWPGPLVCRWNLNRCFGAYGYADAQKKHTPFNALVSEDAHTRAVLARTLRGVVDAGQPAYVTVSNDAEGCAPLSIQKLALAVAAASPIAPACPSGGTT